MSRITIHLKKQVHSPSAAGHRYDEGAVAVSFSRDRPLSGATARKRSNSSSSSGSHADFDVTFARPQRNLASPVPIPADISEPVSARVRERRQNEQDILYIQRKDEESHLGGYGNY
jgi:hypothetical protein